MPRDEQPDLSVGDRVLTRDRRLGIIREVEPMRSGLSFKSFVRVEFGEGDMRLMDSASVFKE